MYKKHFATYRKEPKRSNRSAKLWIIGGILGVIGAFLVWQVSTNGDTVSNFTPEVTGAPRLAVSQESIDYGDVKLNTPVTTVFDVRNTGDQALYIVSQPRVEVAEGCCPPQAQLSTTVIKPGQAATLKLNFSMHEGMGGKHRFLIRVLTNDPAQPEKVLTVLSNWVA